MAEVLGAARERLLEDEVNDVETHSKTSLYLPVRSCSLENLKLLLEHGWGRLLKLQNHNQDSCLH